MSFQVSESLWRDLSLGNNLPFDIFTELVKGSTLGLLANGPLSLKSLRAFAQSAGNAMQTSGGDLLKFSEAIALVLAEGARLNLSLDQFSVFAGQGLDGDKLELMEKVYAEKQEEIRELVVAIAKQQDKLPRFGDLRWRLDCILSSKAIRDVIQPDFLLQISVKKEGKEEKSFLDCSPETLKHIEFTLEEALRLSNSAHSRRMGRV